MQSNNGEFEKMAQKTRMRRGNGSSSCNRLRKPKRRFADEWREA